MFRKNSNGDFKVGFILLVVVVFFLVLGWVIGLFFGDEEVMFIMLVVVLFLGFIGVVLVGFGLMGCKKDEQDVVQIVDQGLGFKLWWYWMKNLWYWLL